MALLVMGPLVLPAHRTAALVGQGRHEVRWDVLLPEVELLHLFFDQYEIVLGQQVKIPLKKVRARFLLVVEFPIRERLAN